MRARSISLLTLFIALAIVLGGTVEGAQVSLSAPCNVTGLIGVDTTWSPTSCDYYVVTGNLIVQQDVTLTLEPGTLVKFDSLKAMTVQGSLIAIGTDIDPIVFTSNSPAPAKGDWGYIHFTDTSADNPTCDNSGSILQYSVVEYAGGVNTNENGALRIELSAPCLDQNVIGNNKADGIHVWNNGHPRITNNNIHSNGILAQQVGGKGISYSSGSGGFLISGNTVSDNVGSGIYVNVTGAATISSNTVTNNTASGSGGGIYVSYGSNHTISNNTVTGNTAANGGGIHIAGGSATVIGNTVTDNAAVTDGGGIFSDSGSRAFGNNIVTNNMAGDDGGGIYSTSSGATFSGNTIDSNTAGDDGGGIYSSGSNTIFGSNTVTGNTASDGAGVYMAVAVLISESIITGNNASLVTGQGGGIFLCNGCRPSLYNNDICGNSDAFDGDLYNANANGTPDINAENNYWGEAEAGAVENHVWHFVDDAGKSIVDYVPFYTEPVSGDPDVCNVPLPEPCSLDLLLAYNGSELSLTFDFYTGPTPVQWRNFINIQGTWIPLWAMGLPADFPYSNAFSFPFGNFGPVQFYTDFVVSGQGVVCSDFETIETGAIDGAIPAKETLQELFQLELR